MQETLFPVKHLILYSLKTQNGGRITAHLNYAEKQAKVADVFPHGL